MRELLNIETNFQELITFMKLTSGSVMWYSTKLIITTANIEQPILSSTVLMLIFSILSIEEFVG